MSRIELDAASEILVAAIASPCRHIDNVNPWRRRVLRLRIGGLVMLWKKPLQQKRAFGNSCGGLDAENLKVVHGKCDDVVCGYMLI
ncbi:MAG TPA: hypothetical protein VIY68_14055 [Steroidobacteraceae bacterium]